jgi:hypothetical protein
MGFDIVAVRTAESDDGCMYPVVVGRGRAIEMEEIDGGDIRTFSATALAVGEVSEIPGAVRRPAWDRRPHRGDAAQCPEGDFANAPRSSFA